MKKKLIATIFIIIIFCAMFSITAKASSGDLYLNNLEFTAKINSDGSMNVTELWDINIEDTNTLFKTFKTDTTKYSVITDVKVTDITGGNVEFTEINTYMYHVTKNCYYGLKNDEGNFEIAWGVGLNNQSATKKYKIEYKIKDVIAKYNDYAELYWQFIGQDFEISANKVKGNIILPANVDGKENIKVWGHTKDLNGTVYATDLNKIEFELEKYKSGRFVEIRTLFPTNLISSTKRKYNTNILDTAIAEETKWADEANRQRELNKATHFIICAVIIVTMIILFIIFVKKIKKYKNVLKQLNKYKPTNELEYYRELPDENATPGEAVFLLKELYTDFNADFGKIFSATLLNLSLKKYIELKVNDEKNGKKAIIIKITNNDKIQLKNDEKEIFRLLTVIAHPKEEITMKELEKYIKNHPTDIERLIKNIHKSVKENVTQSGYFDKSAYNQYEKYLGMAGLYIFGVVFLFALLPISIVFIINAVYCYKIKNRINVLTQTGIDQKEMWKGLKKYMEDFSLLKEREVPEIVIWEKYLVYATAFGIADKVLKQLKIVYPNIDQLDTLNTSAYMYFMYHSNFNTNFTNAINTSIASATYSSGTGSGGGFSGGGGFGGRWPEEVEVDNTTLMNN